MDRIRTIVVLPAPLGPRSARIVPSSTAKLTLSSTTWSPNDLHTSSSDDPAFQQTRSSWPSPSLRCGRFVGKLARGTQRLPLCEPLLL